MNVRGIMIMTRVIRGQKIVMIFGTFALLNQRLMVNCDREVKHGICVQEESQQKQTEMHQMHRMQVVCKTVPQMAMRLLTVSV